MNKRITYSLTDECYKDIVNNKSENGSMDFSKLSHKKVHNTLVIVTPDKELRLMNLVNANDKVYGIVYPEPFETLFEQAQIYAKTVYDIMPKVVFDKHLLGSVIEPKSQKNEVYLIEDVISRQYVGYKISGLVLAIMALECFCNSSIPEDYLASDKNGQTIDKQRIEREYSIKEKISLIKKHKHIDNRHFDDCASIIIECNQLRGEVVHIKSAKEEAIHNKISDAYGKLLNLDLLQLLSTIKDLILIIDPSANFSM